MKKFCIFLREHAADVINFEKKKMLLTEKELTLHQVQPYFTFAEKNLNKNLPKKKIIRKLETINILLVNTEVNSNVLRKIQKVTKIFQFR